MQLYSCTNMEHHCAILLTSAISDNFCCEGTQMHGQFMGCKCFGVFGRREVANGDDLEANVKNKVRLFSYNALRQATGHFHPPNKIGGGGYGVVYKGVLRDGTRVAVKTLSAESKQGTKEFLSEINIISDIQHQNLVGLIGCCIEGNHRILVYEYMENNSLASALLGSKAKRINLDWSQRAAICNGTANGLAFLHEEAVPSVVHRDIKASNVLLDDNLLPKISDFGMAKLFPENVTHLTTHVAGTVGYLAPEYSMFGQLTKKADVYSFGVLLLEVISGRSSANSSFGDDLSVLVEWAWNLKEEGRLPEIVDPTLKEYPEHEVLRFIKVALFCSQSVSRQRPDMKQVVEMLSREVNLNEDLLTKPGVLKPPTSHQSSSNGFQSSSGVGNIRKTAANASTSTIIHSSYVPTEVLPI